jgi:hypothetical protein
MKDENIKTEIETELNMLNWKQGKELFQAIVDTMKSYSLQLLDKPKVQFSSYE